MVVRQTARIPLGVGGVDAKSDGKHIPVGKWDGLQNVELRADGSIRKRRALGTSGGGTLATLTGGGRRLAVGNGAYGGVVALGVGQSESGAEWGGSFVTSARPIAAKKRYEYDACQVVEYDGDLYCALAEHDVVGGTYQIRMVVIDPATGEFQQKSGSAMSGVPATIADLEMRAVAIPDHGVLVLWHDQGASLITGRIFYDGQWRNSYTFHAAATDYPFDAVVDSTGDTLYLAAKDSGTTGVIKGWTITGSTYFLTFTPLASSQPIAHSGLIGMAMCLDEVNGYVAVTTAAAASGRCYVCPLDLTSVGSVQTSGDQYGGTVWRCGIVLSASGEVTCLTPHLAAIPAAHYHICITSVDLATVAIIDDTHKINGCTLAHRPVMDGTTMYFGVSHDIADTETHYRTMAFRPSAVNSRPYTVASYAYGGPRYVGGTAKRQVSAVVPVATGTGTRWYWMGSVRTEVRTSSGAGTLRANLVPTLFSWDSSTERVYSNAFSHGATLVAGGEPHVIVENRALPAGLPTPHIRVAAGAATGGNMTGSTTHLVKAVYELMDASGRVWRSAPSTPFSVTLGAGDDSITAYVVTPPWHYAATSMEDRQTIQVALYMTEASGTIYYRASPHAAAEDVDFQRDDEITITATDSDVTISANEILYTDAGLLPNRPPPPCTVVASHKQRFAAVHSETGDIWFTKEFEQGEGLGWSDVLRVTNPVYPELPTAIVSTDSALVVFYRDRIGFIYGDGPSNQGLGQSFTPIQFLPDADVGAVGHRAVQKIPGGIFFLDADKGFHVMPYGGGPPQYVGRDVDGAPAETVVGTVHLPDRHEVRVVFYNALTVASDSGGYGSGVGWFTWHYDRAAWSYGVAVDHTSAIPHATADGNTFILGTVAEKAGRGYDGTDTYVTMMVVTGWITLSEATRKQGLFRLLSAHLLCESVDEAWAGVIWRYNHDTTDLSAASVVHTTSQLKVYPAKQLIQSFMLRIYDAESGGTTTGEGFELSDIELHYGVYPGVKPRVSGANVVA